MSQWGTTKRIKNCLYTPHVNTITFAEINPESIIDYIILHSCFKKMSENKKQKALNKVRKKYIGKPYKTWTGQEKMTKTMV